MTIIKSNPLKIAKKDEPSDQSDGDFSDKLSDEDDNSSDEENKDEL